MIALSMISQLEVYKNKNGYEIKGIRTEASLNVLVQIVICKVSTDEHFLVLARRLSLINSNVMGGLHQQESS